MMEALAKEIAPGSPSLSFRRRQGMRASKKRYFGYEAVLGTIKAGKILILASFAILLLALGHYFLIVSYFQHREWVKNQLELQLQVLTKNLRFIDRKVEIASTSGRSFNRRNLSKV